HARPSPPPPLPPPGAPAPSPARPAAPPGRPGSCSRPGRARPLHPPRPGPPRLGTNQGEYAIAPPPRPLFDTRRHVQFGPWRRWEARGMAAGSPLLQLEQVNKWFGDLHVLQDVDLEVDPGEVVVVVGPSGSGKSTLCRTINRLEPIDNGTIRLEGQPLPAGGRATPPPGADRHRQHPPRGPAPARRGPGPGQAPLRRRHGLPAVQPVRPQERPRERHPRPDQGPRPVPAGGRAPGP